MLWHRCASSCFGVRLMLAAITCAATAGCMGSWALRGTRITYNQSLSHTASQEILLNIVRMRYGETPTFLDLPSIISQTEAGINGTGGQAQALQGAVDGVFSLRDTPTLSYQPRSGDNLAASMLRAMPANAIMDVSPGNDTRIFLMAFVDSINGVRNSPTATSPASRVLEPNDEFRYGVDLFTGLQNRGAVKMRVATLDEKPQGSPLPAKDVLSMDMFTATDNGYVFQVSGDDAVLLKRSRFVALTIKPEENDAADIHELKRIFRLLPEPSIYRVKAQEDDEIDLDASQAGMPLTTVPAVGDAAPDVTNAEGIELLPSPPRAEPMLVAADSGPELDDDVSINLRSGYQTLAFLSKGVDVPDAHMRRGAVICYRGLDGRPFDARQLTNGLFHVCVQKHRPLRSDLAVHYRGYWFYIPEDDVQSRATLNFVKLVIDVRSQASVSPVLTLPISGGR
ncbi:MAG: hypothetical protein EBR28_06025 [Planctomycetia bacterium]|nr:hypothetical protein [Planctomycetia bacterium]